MSKLSFLPSLMLVSILTLAACTRNQSASNSPATNPTPAPAAPAASPLAQASPSSSPTALAQTYKEESGLFEISFPDGYQYQKTDAGIAFVSGDKSFAGSIDFASAQGKTLNTSQLEESLKAEYQKRLDKVSWQGSELQPDGSIRVDWIGRDKDGNDLDAVSFVEQRGDTIFILNLFGINKPYQTYNSDAEAIVGSYKVRQQ